MNGRNVFAGAFVDRSGYRREDPAWLRSAMGSAETTFVPVWGDKCLAAGEPVRAVLVDRPRIGELLDPEQAIFLGVYRGKPAFAVPVDAADAPLAELGQFHPAQPASGGGAGK